jgi:succinate-semialdehyde dehydrogenase / glutarate-semialdehyde dehydrogenase
MGKAAEAIKTQKNIFRNLCLIGGEWHTANNGHTFPVDDPDTGEIIAHVPYMGTMEARMAITAAKEAFPKWSSRPAEERADFLWRWHQLILENIDGLAHILTAEQGKPLREAKGEVKYAAAFVRFFAEEARRVYGETIPSSGSDSRIVVLKEPIGVVAGITPWNFPAAMITRKAAPAIAAGCTVVIKPAEATPLSALALAGLAEKAGAPAGILNIITGDANTIGLELCNSPHVRKLSFTGSTSVGRLLARQSADTVKRVSLELGGNAPFIVFDDADLDDAVNGAVLCKFRHSGQTCVTANRFIIHSKIFEEFSLRLVEKIKTLKFGSGFDSDTDVGPLINDSAVSKVEHHVADALTKGASLLAGGDSRIDGRFYPPTVLSNVRAEMRITQEEIFGPVVTLMQFRDESEALRIANSTDYGLAGYFYSRDVSKLWRVARKLECGMIGINTGFLSIETAPFGGVKQSGYGREGSRHGIAEFLEMKYLHIGGILD